MRLHRLHVWAGLVLGLFFASSCEKKETPIARPEPGPATIAQVAMGEDYADQIFYSFANKQAVMVSKINSWDLAFETSPAGFHVFMNGGKDVALFNTHLTDASMVNQASGLVIRDTSWGFDSPDGSTSGTYVGDWRPSSTGSKAEVFLLKYNDGSFRKFAIASVSDTNYVLLYGDVNSSQLSSISIPKDAQYNFSYVSLESGCKLVYPEPAKTSYDIVFTRYRHIYYDLDNFRYPVTGVLLNPYGTSAIADSLTGFSALSFSSFAGIVTFSADRNIIGFDWKNYDFNTGDYKVNANKCYIIKTQQNQIWKLHFLDFYDASGHKGSPTFEFEQIH